jgi:hypothetical protein
MVYRHVAGGERSYVGHRTEIVTVEVNRARVRRGDAAEEMEQRAFVRAACAT